MSGTQNSLFWSFSPSDIFLTRYHSSLVDMYLAPLSEQALRRGNLCSSKRNSYATCTFGKKSKSEGEKKYYTNL